MTKRNKPLFNLCVNNEQLRASQVVLVVGDLRNVVGSLSQGEPLGQGEPLEEGTATHPSILAWRIPWAEEPGGL